MKAILIITFIIVLLLTGYTIFSIEFRFNDWDNAIREHKSISDSLRLKVDSLRADVNRRDNLLITEMSSIDALLNGLKVNSMKNRELFDEGLQKLDSIKDAYCEEMRKLGPEYTPEECN